MARCSRTLGQGWAVCRDRWEGCQWQDHRDNQGRHKRRGKDRCWVQIQIGRNTAGRLCISLDVCDHAFIIDQQEDAISLIQPDAVGSFHQTPGPVKGTTAHKSRTIVYIPHPFSSFFVSLPMILSAVHTIFLSMKRSTRRFSKIHVRRHQYVVISPKIHTFVLRSCPFKSCPVLLFLYDHSVDRRSGSAMTWLTLPSIRYG